MLSRSVIYNKHLPSQFNVKKNSVYRYKKMYCTVRHEGPELPKKCDTLVVGGGLTGLSVAYFLKKKSPELDIVVLEQSTISSGTTWYSSGFLKYLQQSFLLTDLSIESSLFYKEIADDIVEDEELIDDATDRYVLDEQSTLYVAREELTLNNMIESMNYIKTLGYNAVHLTPAEIKDKYSEINIDGIVGGIFLELERNIFPRKITQTLGRILREMGVNIIENCPAKKLERRKNRIASVVTGYGPDIQVNTLVLTTGVWNRQIAGEFNMGLPFYPLPHQYGKTEHFDLNIPCINDVDNKLIVYSSGFDLIVNPHKKNVKQWNQINDGRVPDYFPQSKIPTEISTMDLDDLHKILPATKNTSLKEVIASPEAYSFDKYPIIGPVYNLENVFVSCGFNANGVTLGGGAGKLLAEWILDGKTSFRNSWQLDVQRCYPDFAFTNELCRDRAVEVYRKKGFPNNYYESDFITSRNIRKSSLHELTSSLGAEYKQILGWEVPKFYIDSKKDTEKVKLFENNWMGHFLKEQLACHSGVGIIDQSSLGKISISGKDCLPFLQKLLTNTIHLSEKVTHSLLLNDKGGVIAELDIVFVEENTFFLTVDPEVLYRVFHQLRNNVAEGEDIYIRDFSKRFGTVEILGKNSDDIMDRWLETKLEVGHSITKIYGDDLKCRIIKTMKYGFPCYQIHTLSERIPVIYKDLVSFALENEIPMSPVGHYALESLRVESGTPIPGRDISINDSPINVGLLKSISLDHEFIGKESLKKFREVDRFFVRVIPKDSKIKLSGRELIMLNGKCLGDLTSVGYSALLDTSIAFGLVKQKMTKDLIRAKDIYLLSSTGEIPCYFTQAVK